MEDEWNPWILTVLDFFLQLPHNFSHQVIVNRKDNWRFPAIMFIWEEQSIVERVGKQQSTADIVKKV